MTLLPEKITIGSRQSRLAKTQVEIFIKHFTKIFGQKNKSKIKLKFFKTKKVMFFMNILQTKKVIEQLKKFKGVKC